MEERTEEQLQQLQKDADKAKGLEEQLKDMVPKDEVEKAVKAKEEELTPQINPNWKKARETIEVMKTALKEKGVETDPEGNVVSNPQKIDVDAIKKEAIQAARGEVLSGHLDGFLDEYDEESGKLVKHFYEKLTQGEDVNLQNMSKFVKQAHGAAETETGNEIKKTTKAVQFSGGQGPRTPEGGTMDETKRKELGQLLGLSFVKDEKK